MMKATNTSWRWLQSVTIATQRLSTRSFSSRVRVRDLPTPSFLINRHVFQRNCQTVLDAAESHNLKLRPHVKTHKTIPGAILQATGQITGTANVVAELIESKPVTGFVASSIPEVEMLVNASSEYGGGPFEDILYGVPISGSKLDRICGLDDRLASGRVHVLVDHPQQAEMLERYAESANRVFSVFVKLDTGYHRAGIACDDSGINLLRRIVDSPQLVLYGVYSHCGHAYDVSNIAETETIVKTDQDTILSFLTRANMEIDSLGDLTISVGSTPSVFHHTNGANLPNMEIHPGNYTLFDRQQMWTGACGENDVAGRVIARIIGHYEDRDTIMVDAGATALTKEQTPQGEVFAVGGHPELECYKMSQEVSLIRHKDPEVPFPFSSFPLDSVVDLLPNHSCLAAACFDRYFVIHDENEVVPKDAEVLETWVPAKFF